jgi:hypothetical protein
MASQPYPGGTFPVQFFGGGIKRSIVAPNPGGPGGSFKAGGSVLAGGTLQNNAIFDNTFGTLNYPYQGIHNAYNDNKPINGLSLDHGSESITKAVSAGSFATMTAGQYVMLTFNSQIAGIPTNILRSPGSSYRKSQNPNIGWVDTLLINKTGGWYYNNGLPINPVNTRDSIGTENFPGNYGIPGRLTFLSTGKLAVPQSYSSKSD